MPQRFSKVQQGWVQLRSGRGQAGSKLLVGQEMGMGEMKTCHFPGRPGNPKGLLNEEPPELVLHLKVAQPAKPSLCALG